MAIPSGEGPARPIATTASERDRELVDLFSGRVGPDALPVVPTNDGTSFEPSLRATLLAPMRYQPSFDDEPPTVTGALGLELITHSLSMVKPRLLSCYRVLVREAPGVEGAVAIEVDVSAEGEVKATHVTAPKVAGPGAATPGLLANAGFKTCLERALQSLGFPKVEKPSVIRYAGRFSTRDSAPRAEPAPSSRR